MKSVSIFFVTIVTLCLSSCSGSHEAAKTSNVEKDMTNPVIHFEIGCKDIAKTTEFYTSLFGWTPTNAGIASYINTNSTEGIQGHITSLGHEPYNYVTVYIQVDDIEKHLQKIQSAGGHKIVGPIKLPTGQQFAWFKDLDGNVVGLLTKPKK